VPVFAGLIAANLPDGSEVLTAATGDFTSIPFPFYAQSGRRISHGLEDAGGQGGHRVCRPYLLPAHSRIHAHTRRRTPMMIILTEMAQAPDGRQII
jgi:hypothetical protein